MDVLSNDFQVCMKIYEYNQRDEKIWYSKLIKDMTISQATISASIDKLVDVGMIDRHWEKVKSGTWELIQADNGMWHWVNTKKV